ncbi:MAG: serine/threonine protein kinase [Deltaproteobacteria bacterium]|nr:MAG: serine/threonine protein kinase [Deltaproteobacteria bacterium]
MEEGMQIGAYQIVRPLATGGMSEVWVAEHALLGRRAAIKVLRPRLSRQSEIVRRLFNEARIMTAIANPGIVQVFDFGFHGDGSAYIVMELLDGETLGDRLARRGPLAIGDALHVVRQVASALCAAHVRGIVHRDLKPENIFLARDAEVIGGERAKILDFGIAKLLDDDAGVSQESMVLGTPPFMSPEQCRGAATLEQRSDVYSLGCVLFTMITGRPPFGEGCGAVLAMHQLEPPPLPSHHAAGVPAVVDHLVLRCLAKDPAERFTACELARTIGGLLHAPWRAGLRDRPDRRERPGFAALGHGSVDLDQRATEPHTALCFDTAGATLPLPSEARPPLDHALRAVLLELAVLALVLGGMAWLVVVLLLRLA